MSYELIVFVYSTWQLPPELIPSAHADFARILNSYRDLLRDRVASRDTEHSGSAFLLATGNTCTTSVFWDITEALGDVNANLYIITAAMLERVASGGSLLVYDMIESHVARYTDRNPALIIKMPTDYTLVATRVTFITRRAARPNAACLWLDFMLSHGGQNVMADRTLLFSLCQNVETGLTAKRLLAELGNMHQLIPVGPGLLAHQDQLRRADFLKRWHVTLGRWKENKEVLVVVMRYEGDNSELSPTAKFVAQEGGNNRPSTPVSPCNKRVTLPSQWGWMCVTHE